MKKYTIRLTAEQIKQLPVESTKNEQGRYVNNVRDGEWFFYHDNGEKKGQGTYDNGSKVGLWTTWYPSGQIEEIGSYCECNYYDYKIGRNKLERREGKWVRYFSNGAKCEEGAFDMDIKNGEWLRWHTNGKIRETGNYVAGRLIGSWKSWYSCGALRENGEFCGIPVSNLFLDSLLPVERWRFPDWDWDNEWLGDIDISRGEKYPQSENGIKNGRWLYYFCNGKIKVDVEYVDGYRNGIWRSWHANGCKEKEGEYAMGNAFGKWVEWYDNGQIRDECCYDIEDFEPTYDPSHLRAMDRSVGLSTTWFKNGQKRSEMNYVRVKCESSGRMRSEYGAYIEWEEDGSLKVPKNETSNDAKKSLLKTLFRFFKI